MCPEIEQEKPEMKNTLYSQLIESLMHQHALANELETFEIFHSNAC